MKSNRKNLFQTLQFLNPQSLKSLSSTVIVLVESKLWAKVLFAMFLGVSAGVGLSESGPFSELLVNYKSFVESGMSWLVLPAQLFLKLIKMVIIPLIFSSIIGGLASTTSAEQLKRLGGRFALFVLSTTVLASTVGIVLTKLLKPGRGMALGRRTAIANDGLVPSEAAFNFGPEKLLDILPTNPLSSFVEGQMLDVVVIAIIMGVALLSIEKEKARGMMDVLGVVQQTCMQVISWAMKLAPYAVFGMMAKVTSSTGIQTLQNMAMYVVVCFLGFTFFVLFYSLLVFLIKGMSPIKYLRAISTPLLLAFSTSSSAATMPVTLKVVEDELEIDPSSARFLIPMGATVNMAGSAIWHTSAVIFLSQVYGIDLSLPQISIVVATSIASSVGSPGVPGVGIGILATILAKVGIPLEGVSLIMGVDRIVDMGCTVVNVAGDITAAKLLSPEKKNKSKPMK